MTKPRPPIVVVVGHVDHGKTTLLDYIRKANVAAREAGGITQATAAYEITHSGRKITFIDTPGHEAFTAMRSRGAQAADLAILVVAADDGVKPQTKEAIKILAEAKTPFIVALNKVDKVQDAHIEKVKGELMTAGVMLEGYGGQVSYHGVSAKTGEGVNDLLDLILLAADVEDLKYDPAARAEGFVLEVSHDPRRGIEATVILREGTLKQGDFVSTPSVSGKVKILEDFQEKSVSALEPSAPAIIIGFEGIPKVGEKFMVEAVKREQAAKIAGNDQKKAPPKAGTTLNLILKASDGGSLEALSVVLKSIDQKRGKAVNIIDEAVGDITDGDVKHAMATNSTIIGFKNKVEKGAAMLAEGQSVTIITSKIVYDLAKSVEDFLSGAAGPAAAGELEVLAVFNQAKLDKQLVGGRVLLGVFRSKATCDILRTGTEGVLASGRIVGLREKKAEILSAEKGKEIGVLISSSAAILVGDKLVIHK
jgi:translation initiation factor IF-2